MGSGVREPKGQWPRPTPMNRRLDPPCATTPRSRRGRATLLVSAALLALALGACSGGEDSASDSKGVSADSVPAPAKADGDNSSTARDGAFYAGTEANRAALQDALEAESAAIDRSIISVGVVSLRSDDVSDAIFEVRKVVATAQGEITDEKTETGDEGVVRRSQLVLRVPVANFDQAMLDLEDLGQLETSSRNSEDVTTEVIDTEVRIRAQEKSLERVEVLLARAQSIRDIVAIETQLTRRQAALDSLKSQQAYLADQTSMSTITVHLQTKAEKKERAEKDETGFLAGLASGWHGLKSFTNGLATMLGALLPFAIVGLVLGVPLWFATRRFLAQRSAAPAPAAVENS